MECVRNEGAVIFALHIPLRNAPLHPSQNKPLPLPLLLRLRLEPIGQTVDAISLTQFTLSTPPRPNPGFCSAVVVLHHLADPAALVVVVVLVVVVLANYLRVSKFTLQERRERVFNLFKLILNEFINGNLELGSFHVDKVRIVMRCLTLENKVLAPWRQSLLGYSRVQCQSCVFVLLLNAGNTATLKGEGE